jgi:hypothetical protein
VALLSRLHRDGTATPKALDDDDDAADVDAEGAQPQTLTRVIATLEERWSRS